MPIPPATIFYKGDIMYCANCKALDADVIYFEGAIPRYVCDGLCLEEYLMKIEKTPVIPEPKGEE